MDPAIAKSTERQSELDAAKAAFFAANGSIQHIPRGIGRDSPGSEAQPRQAYGYGRIAPAKSKRGRLITGEEKAALAVRLTECKANGMSRYKASKHLEISETLCRKLIADFALDFPATG